MAALELLLSLSRAASGSVPGCLKLLWQIQRTSRLPTAPQGGAVPAWGLFSRLQGLPMHRTTKPPTEPKAGGVEGAVGMTEGKSMSAKEREDGRRGRAGPQGPQRQEIFRATRRTTREWRGKSSGRFTTHIHGGGPAKPCGDSAPGKIWPHSASSAKKLEFLGCKKIDSILWIVDPSWVESRPNHFGFLLTPVFSTSFCWFTPPTIPFTTPNKVRSTPVQSNIVQSIPIQSPGWRWVLSH